MRQVLAGIFPRAPFKQDMRTIRLRLSSNVLHWIVVWVYGPLMVNAGLIGACLKHARGG